MEKDSKYDKNKADFAVNFIECLSHTKGKWSGKPFELLDWQEQIIRDLFGIINQMAIDSLILPTLKFRRRTANQNLRRQ